MAASGMRRWMHQHIFWNQNKEEKLVRIMQDTLLVTISATASVTDISSSPKTIILASCGGWFISTVVIAVQLAAVSVTITPSASLRQRIKSVDDRPSSQYPQLQHNHTFQPANKVVGAFEPEERTLHDEMYLDDKTENSPANELSPIEVCQAGDLRTKLIGCPDTMTFALPSSIKYEEMGKRTLTSPIYAPTLYVPSPTIHFGSLVFEFLGNTELKLVGIEDPDDIEHAGQELLIPRANPTKEDMLDPADRHSLDYSRSKEEQGEDADWGIYMSSHARDTVDASVASSNHDSAPISTPEPSHTVSCGFQREERTLHDAMDLDDKTEKSCNGAHETPTNELQRTSSQHRQQHEEGYTPEPNAPGRDHSHRKQGRYHSLTRKPRSHPRNAESTSFPSCKTHSKVSYDVPPSRFPAPSIRELCDCARDHIMPKKRERSIPDLQATPQETQESNKKRHVSNEQRLKHFFMDSGAANHSTFDPAVIRPYPPNIKQPIRSINGFAGATVLVTGYGRVDGHGGNLNDVLFIPDSSANLVSLGQLTRDYSVKVVFYSDKFWIEGLQNGERIGEGHRNGDSNHYVLDRFEPDLLVDHLK